VRGLVSIDYTSLCIIRDAIFSSADLRSHPITYTVKERLPGLFNEFIVNEGKGVVPVVFNREEIDFLLSIIDVSYVTSCNLEPLSARALILALYEALWQLEHLEEGPLEDVNREKLAEWKIRMEERVRRGKSGEEKVGGGKSGGRKSGRGYE